MPDSLLPLVLTGPLLIATMLSDLRRLRIPNAYSIAALGLFALTALVWPPHDLVPRLIVAGLVFIAGYIGFARGLVGGGDVKILSVLMLFVPVQALALFANVFSASLLLGVAALIALRRIPGQPPTGWAGIWGSRAFPMGMSIGLAGLAFPWVFLWLQGG